MEEMKGNEKMTSSGKILKSGEIIRPLLTKDIVESLVQRLYGISCQDIKEMNSYDDKNYKITEDPNMKNPLIAKHWPHGYVLKVMNSLDSQKLSFVEALTEAMIYLSNHQVMCPKPIRNVYGHYFSLEKLPSGKSHVVRLLEFQPGEILINVPKSEYLYYQMGEYVANLDRLLKNFYHSGFVDHKHIWMLDSVPELTAFKDAITEPDLLLTIDQVIEEFNKTIIPQMDSLEKGIIHGDFNEQNIIVNAKGKDDWRITAVIDFGDFSISPYLFELAITMTYAMLVTGELRTGGLVYAGYSTVRIVPDNEIPLLKVCIAARLCQSIIMGTYTHKQNPDNEYVLTTRKAVMNLLPLIWNSDNEDLMNLWKSVGNDYLTRSSR